MSSSERGAYSEADESQLMRFWPLATLPAAIFGWFLGIAVHEMLPHSQSPPERRSGQLEVASPGRTLWQFRPADAKSWRLSSDAARVENLGGGMLRLHGDRTGTGAQLESLPIEVRQGERLHISWSVRAVSGQMAVGIFDAIRGVWINAVSIGDKDIDLKFATPTTTLKIIVVNNHSGDAPSIADLGPAFIRAE